MKSDDIKFDKEVLNFLAYIGQREQLARKEEREDMKKRLVEDFKKAFFEVFTGAGELWFPYNIKGMNDSSEEEMREPVSDKWEELLKIINEG